MEALAIVSVVIFCVGVGVMIVLDIFLAGDRIRGNTFSQLARASIRHTYWLPFCLAAFLGRWYHPVDGFESVVGKMWFAHLVFVVLGAIVVLGSQSLKRYRNFTMPAWVIVLVGLVMGAVIIPVPSS